MMTYSQIFSGKNLKKSRSRYFSRCLMGCTALVATSFISNVAAQVAPPITVEIDVIVEDGDLEPELGGTFFLGIPGAGLFTPDLPLIDNNGKVYFFGYSDDGTGPFNNELTAGIWSSSGGTPIAIIMDGMILPLFTPLVSECTTNSTTCGEIFHTNPGFTVTPAGELMVLTSRDDLLGTRVILAGNRFDNLAPLVTDAQSSAPFVFGNSVFFANDNGKRVIGTLFGSDPFGTPTTGLTDFAAGLIGAEAPGIPGVNITKILGSSIDGGSVLIGLNNRNDLLFAAELDNGGNALYLSSGQGSPTFSLIARTGDAAPGISGAELFIGTVFSSATFAHINNSGQGMFKGTWVFSNSPVSGGNKPRTGLWRFDANGTPVLVVSEFNSQGSGNPVTDPIYVTSAGNRTVFGVGLSSAGINAAKISPNGDIYFFALGKQLDANGTTTDSGVFGLWKAPADGGMIQLVLKQHMNPPGNAPDTPGTILSDGSELWNFPGFDYTFDADGSLIIEVRTVEPGSVFVRKALYAEDSTGTLQRIIRDGDTLEVAPGIFREVQDFNFGISSPVGSTSASFRNDRIALSVKFTDNTNAILRARFTGGTLEVTEFIWFGSCGDTNWHGTCNDSGWNNNANGSPANKSPGDATGTEKVTIVNKDVVISDRAVHLDTLNATGSLEVNQALTLEGLSSIEDLTLKSDLTANAALSLSGANNVWNDGVISGTGIVTVDNGAVFTLSPTGGSLDLKTALKILGDAKQTGGSLNLGSIGNVTINPGGKYDLMEGNIASDQVAAANFINGGVFLKSGDTTSIVEAFFENQASGEIRVDAGKLTFNGPNILAGNIRVSDGARAEFAGSDLATELNSFAATGPGVVIFSDGIFLKDGTTSVFTITGADGKLIIADGTKINGTGTLENAGNMEFAGAAELRTKLNVTGSGSTDQFGNLTLHGVDAKIQVERRAGYFLHGNSSILNGSPNNGGLILDGSLVKMDAGTTSKVEVDIKHIGGILNVKTSANLAVVGKQTFISGDNFFNGDGSLSVMNMLTNGGTLKSNMTGDGILTLLGETTLTGGKLINDGNIDWQAGKITGGSTNGMTATNGLRNNDSGKLTISTPVLLQDGVIDNFGTVNINQNLTMNSGVILNQTNATIYIGALGNIASLDGGSSLIDNIGGTLKKSDGLASQISASYSSDGGTTSVTNGTLQFREGVTFKGDSKASIDVGARLELRNGETRVTDLFTITGDGTFQIGGEVLNVEGMLTNEGNIEWLGGMINGSSGAILNKKGKLTITGEVPHILNTVIKNGLVIINSSITSSDGTGEIQHNEMLIDSSGKTITVEVPVKRGLAFEIAENTTAILSDVGVSGLGNDDIGNLVFILGIWGLDGSWEIHNGAKLTLNGLNGTFSNQPDLIRIQEFGEVILHGNGTITNLPQPGMLTNPSFSVDGILELRDGAQWSSNALVIDNGGTLIVDKTSSVLHDGTILSLAVPGITKPAGFVADSGSHVRIDGTLTVGIIDEGNIDPEVIKLFFDKIVISEFADLSGSGTINGHLIQGGKLSPGNSPGTMTINGVYTQTSTGVLAIELGGFEAGTEYDQLIVNGTATFEAGSSIEITLLDLDGDGKVFIPKGRSSFDIIVSDNLILPTGADLANLVSVTNAPNGLRVSLAPSGAGDGFGFKLLTVFGSTLLDLSNQFTPGQTMVAGALDGASTGTATDGLLDFALAIDDLGSVSAKQDALEQAGLSFAAPLFAMSRIGSDAAHDHLGRHFDSMIWAVAENNDRMASIKNGAANNLITMSYGQKNQPGAFNDANDVMRFAKNFADNAGGSTALASGGGLKVFVAGSYEFGNYDATLNQTGFDYSGAAVSLGTEYNNQEQGLTFGVAGSVSTLNGTIDLGRGAVDSTTYGLSAYGLVQIAESAALDVTVSYGNVKNSYRRAVTIPGQAFTATGDANGNYLTGTARFAYAIEAGNGKIGPYGQIRYSRISLDGFSETGGGDASLIIGKGIEKFVTGQIGLRATLPMRTSIGYVIPRFSAGWNYILDQTSPTLAARFVGGPDDSFSILTDNYSRNGLALNAGLTIQSSDVLRFSVDYQGLLFNKDHGEHSLVGRARWMF